MASEVEPAKAKLNWAKIKANVKEKGYQVDNSFNKSSRGGSPTNDGSPGGGLKRRMSSNNLKKENSGSFKAKQTVLASWGSPSPSASPPSPHRMNSRQLLWEEPPPLPPPTWLPAQVHVANVYHHRAVQLFIASVIVSSFVASIMEKEWDPDRVAYPALWPLLDNLFNSIFLVEILANAYSHNIITFLRRGWNLFDLLVVVVGICTMAKIDLGPVSAVKVFRVFRLFPRVPSLNELFISILRSIPGVINALIILFLVMCIYGILGVTLFKRFGSAKDPYVTTDSFGEGVDVIYALTTPKQCLRDADPARDSKQCHSDREMLLGEEYWGTFSRSLFTLLQVLTGESWSEAVARPIIFGFDGKTGAFFFCSFVLLFHLVLVQVVIAVLLDRILPETPEDDGEPTEEAEGESPVIDEQPLESSNVTSAVLGAPSILPVPAAAAPTPALAALVDGDETDIDDKELSSKLGGLSDDMRQVAEALSAISERKARLDLLLSKMPRSAVLAALQKLRIKALQRAPAKQARSVLGKSRAEMNEDGTFWDILTGRAPAPAPESYLRNKAKLAVQS